MRPSIVIIEKPDAGTVDLVAFVAALSIACLFDWKTSDLVWGLWFSSLTLGTLSTIVTVVAGLYLGIKALKKKDITIQLIGIGFMFLWMPLWVFWQFHMGLANFYEKLFPIGGLALEWLSPRRQPGLGLWSLEYLSQPLKMLYFAFSMLLPLYGHFLVAMLVTERRKILAPLLRVREVLRESSSQEHPASKIVSMKEKEGRPTWNLANFPFVGPWLEVARLVLLTFFFVMMSIIGQQDRFFVYITAYAVCYFPWALLRKQFKK